jgi:N4-gp56 family major capsid protein
MAIQTTSNLSNSIRAQYLEKYVEGAQEMRLYDQLAAVPVGLPLDTMMQGSSVQVPYISAMSPGVTAISELTDVVPQTLRDSTASITATSRGEVLQFSQTLEIEAYTDYAASAYKAVGENQMMSVDLLAQAAALNGSQVYRAAARASLDAGTAADLMTETKLAYVDSMLSSLRIPSYVTSSGRKMWIAIMHPAVFHDLRTSGNVVNVGIYQDKDIILNWELGQIGNFKLIVTPWAKVFGGAGADNATAVATTVASGATALSKTFVTADDVSASIAAGRMWTIGTEETGSTFYPTNEQFHVVSASTTTLTIVGEGPNGGLKYDHAVGEAVRNADSVYPVVYGFPGSIAKVYASEVGEYGEIVGPTRVGNLEQWTQLGWKWWGGYGRFSESSLYRAEFASSMDA